MSKPGSVVEEPSLFFSRYSVPAPCALPLVPLAPSVVWQSAQPINEVSFQLPPAGRDSQRLDGIWLLPYTDPEPNVPSPRMACRE